MGQNEIFKLLLIILLLISNNRDCDDNCRGVVGDLNQIIIIVLLLGLIPTRDCCDRNCGDRNNNNGFNNDFEGGTTF